MLNRRRIAPLALTALALFAAAALIAPAAEAKKIATTVTTDRARSSANGGWLLLAPVSGDLGSTKVKVTRKKLRNGTVCKGTVKPVQITI